ncbi:MFS transporter [candidate division KSB1 bacterium]|nr:MFS transporter [candidate division KSB1 bacterium]
MPISADADTLKQEYRYWRTRILYSTMIGYALFYFVRKNISIAMPVMESELGISKADLGLFLTLSGVLYGVSKFINGFIGDQVNPRYFMAVGLLLSALMNFMFGLSHAVVTFGLFWLFNGWFQGMGFPPCANSLTHWFRPSERGVKFAIWNTSHSVGASLVLVLTGYLVSYSWRLVFFVPGLLAVLGALFIINRVRNTPESLGLPPIEKFGNDSEHVSENTSELSDIEFKQFIKKYVFRNPYIWILSVANFFLYTVRYVILDWGPTFLKEMKGVELHHAGWIVGGYEVFGILGMLAGGWIMDHVFKGRGGRACFIYMMTCALSIVIFWKLDTQSMLINAALLCLIGFSIYGPQSMVGIIAANLATKRAAATAIGVTGFFGYASTVLSGWGLGYLVDHGGWNIGFLALSISATVATVLFAFTWNARYFQYKKNA